MIQNNLFIISFYLNFRSKNNFSFLHLWLTKNTFISNYYYRQQICNCFLLRFLQCVCIACSVECCNSQRDSVNLSVRSSITFRYCIQMNEDTIMRFSASGRTIPLVSGEANFIRNPDSSRESPQWGH